MCGNHTVYLYLCEANHTHCGWLQDVIYITANQGNISAEHIIWDNFRVPFKLFYLLMMVCTCTYIIWHVYIHITYHRYYASIRFLCGWHYLLVWKFLIFSYERHWSLQYHLVSVVVSPNSSWTQLCSSAVLSHLSWPSSRERQPENPSSVGCEARFLIELEQNW